MTTVGMSGPKDSPPWNFLHASNELRWKTSFMARVTDTGFRYLMLACSLSVMVIVGLLLFELTGRSRLSIAQFGFKFFTGSRGTRFR